MPDILFIKTSSLGDVIHHMPAMTEARAHLPDAHIAWVVEEAYAPVASLHPAVNAVIPVDTRRWRRMLLNPAAWSAIAGFSKTLRARAYDIVIDTQGLARTGLTAKLARGRRHGYDAQSVREPIAARFYDVVHAVARDQHAIARNRALTGLALGYAPEGPPDFGLERAAVAGAPLTPYAVLLHATARPEKEWPEDNWIALGKALESRGTTLVLPWASAAERARAERIAAGMTRARVPVRRGLDGMATMIAGAAFVVGVDTGLLHLAAALKVPLLGIFLGSEPGLTGPVGDGPIEVIGTKGAAPSADEAIAVVARIAPEQPRSRARAG